MIQLRTLTAANLRSLLLQYHSSVLLVLFLVRVPHHRQYMHEGLIEPEPDGLAENADQGS